MKKLFLTLMVCLFAAVGMQAQEGKWGIGLNLGYGTNVLDGRNMRRSFGISTPISTGTSITIPFSRSILLWVSAYCMARPVTGKKTGLP